MLNMQEHALYNVDLDASIALGMRKEQIDAILGEPMQEGQFYRSDRDPASMVQQGETYYYPSHPIEITYTDGEASFVLVENDEWMLSGISIGSTRDAVRYAFGEPSSQQLSGEQVKHFIYLLGDPANHFLILDFSRDGRILTMDMMRIV